MEHEKSIFLNDCITKCQSEVGVGNIEACSLMNMILVKGGDIILHKELTESDYFNCLHNTKMADGNFMTQESAEILAKSLINWKPLP